MRLGNISLESIKEAKMAGGAILAMKGVGWSWQLPSATTKDTFSIDYANIDGKAFESGEVYTKISGAETAYMTSVGGLIKANSGTLYRRGAETRPGLGGFNAELVIGTTGNHTGIFFGMKSLTNYYILRYQFNVLQIVRRLDGTDTIVTQYVHSAGSADLNFFVGRVVHVEVRFTEDPNVIRISMDGGKQARNLTRPSGDLDRSGPLGLISASSSLSTGHVVSSFEILNGLQG